jgi:hypothetical protein
MLEIKPRALNMLNEHFITELYPNTTEETF